MNVNESADARWLTPDPAGRAAADPANPQSWNMYAYVLNNPATLVDPLGLDCQGGTSDFNFEMPPNAPHFIITSTRSEPCPTDSLWQLAWDATRNGSVGAVTNGLLAWQAMGHWWNSPWPASSSQLKNVGKTFNCASDFASKYSAAGGLHALGIGTSGAGGFITNALGGNMFSGATDLIESIRSGSAGGHNVFYHMGQGAMAGPSQGVPGVKGPWGASVSDLVTGAIAGGYFRGVTGAGETLTTLSGEVSLSSATMTAAEFASGVGLVKFGYDALSYGAGLLGCKAGVIW